MNPLAEQYKGISGITHKIEYLDDVIIENLEVDYAKIDVAKSIQGLIIDGNTKNIILAKS
ncbi:DUF1307 domain-containing protein [Gemella sp. zg-570]|uniref:DUF1307 domain-containing protein n=1 Tax=unclassified Gemella TaxID=2624949 RepID=UPI001C04BFFF|nr:YehR family protein [Gemella sp. zg-1178]QWQ39568.1 YehR family protein [Gemella sp. zg-570]